MQREYYIVIARGIKLWPPKGGISYFTITIHLEKVGAALGARISVSVGGVGAAKKATILCGGLQPSGRNGWYSWLLAVRGREKEKKQRLRHIFKTAKREPGDKNPAKRFLAVPGKLFSGIYFIRSC